MKIDIDNLLGIWYYHVRRPLRTATDLENDTVYMKKQKVNSGQ